MENLNVVIDVSAVIWDENDYQTNNHEYGNLVNGVAHFFEKLERENPTVLLSANLIDALLLNFPYGKPPYYGGDFETQTLRFLSKVETVEFPSEAIPGVISIPDIIRSHFDANVQNEVKLMISKMHSDEESKYIYFTFDYLWEGESNLKTEFNSIQREYQTIISDRGNQFDDFYESIKPVFEHNPKHDISSRRNREAWERSDDKNGFTSQLSCYNGSDTVRPQEILDKRYPTKIDSRYIGYDEDNGVFVVFRCHIDNKYHGYDEYNESNLEKIPLEVKAFFNKNNE